MSNLFSPLNQLRVNARFRFEPMHSIIQLVYHREHLLEGLRQWRKVFQAVAARAELRPAKRLRSRTYRVHPVTFNTIEPRRVRASRNVTAALEELERLRVTLAAHLKSRGGIGLRDEVFGVCFGFLRLR